jgi:hypothetical protein
MDALGAPHIGERSEADLISAFVEKIAQLGAHSNPMSAFDPGCVKTHLVI